MKIIWFAVLGGVAVLGAPFAVRAQSAQDIERAQQQSQQIIQQQQQQDRLRREQEELRQHTPSGESLTPLPAAPAAPAGKAACSFVKAIDLDGATRIDSATKAALVKPYLDKCLSLVDINRLIADVTNAYIERGFVTTRIYIPQQNVGSGTLSLKVVEGRVESIRLEPPGSASLVTAFPGIVGSVLNLRDLEQGTDQINRLTSNTSHIDIAPGSEPGESVLLVKDEVRKRWLVSAGMDNSGSASTGYDTTTLSASADDFAGWNDYFNLSARHSEAGVDSERHSDGGSVYWNVPYGYWNFSAAVNAFHYGSVVNSQATSFDTDGTSNEETFKAERMLYRDQSIKWGASADLTLKQTWNAIAGERIVASSADLSLLDVGTNVTWARPGTLFSVNAGFTAGMDGLGATEDEADRPTGAPRAQYVKSTYGASLLQLFRMGELPLSLQSSLYGQHSSEPLYGTEQLAIGSLYSVRGFRLDSLSGSTGFYERNDLGIPLTLARVFGHGMPEGQIRPYVGLDYGRVNGVGSLDGWTLGVDVNYSRVSVQLAYSQPISAPSFLPNEHGWLFGRISVTY